MPEFDPHHQWLGIQPHEHPISHYRLLVLREGEANPKVIENAADRTMAFLRQHTSGEHAEDAKRLIEQAVKARVTLLDPQKKAEYDRQLEARRGQTQSQAARTGRPSTAQKRQEPNITSRPPRPAPSTTKQPAPRRSRPGEMPVLATPPGIKPTVDLADRIADADGEQMNTDADETAIDRIKQRANQAIAWVIGPGRRIACGVAGGVLALVILVFGISAMMAGGGVSDEDYARALQERAEAEFELARLNKEFAAVRAERDRWRQAAGIPLDEIDPRPRMPGDQLEHYINSIGMEFRLIPAGRFQMGSPNNELGREDDEGPVHRVEIPMPLLMAVTEVTQTQYEEVIGENPSERKGLHRPVDSVSYYDARNFCSILSRRESRTYRLPTEAEWEYACRAKTSSRFYWGDNDHPDEMKQYCWYDKAADSSFWVPPRAFDEGTQPVGLLRPNPWGLRDMSGNVWEWCDDAYDAKYYTNSPQYDPLGPDATSQNSKYVLRGGCWSSRSVRCRSACRFSHEPETRLSFIGFRVVLEPKEEDENEQE